MKTHLPSVKKTRRRILTSSFLSLQLTLSTLLVGFNAHATPVDKPENSVVRLANQNVVSTQLTRNLFKIEKYQDTYTAQEPYQAEEKYIEKVPYQADEDYYEQVPYQAQENYTERVPYQTQENYTEKVPYQDQEDYYEDVPYQTQEAYTDYEDYWDRENVCETRYENECHQERVCRTIPGERQCHQERVCQPVPGDRNCQMVEECGTSATGERICKTRKVCQDTGPRENCGFVDKCDTGPSHEDCNYENQCHQVPSNHCEYKDVRKQRPVTKYRTVTKYRQERRTRTVTKYRDETRTRTVTKYREETRTRTVTKYRDELRTRKVTKYRDEERTRTVTKYRNVEKCCVTKEREVFDQQVTKDVTLQFPAGSELIGNEKELFVVTLNSLATDVDFSIKNSIFGYQVQEVQKTNTGFNIVLKNIAKYKDTDLSASTISLLRIDSIQQKAIISFNDAGLKPRVNTKYLVKLFNKATQQLVKEKSFAQNGDLVNNQKISLDLETTLDAATDYVAQIQVQRDGIVLSKPVQFSLSAEYLFDRISESEVGEQTVSALSLKDSATGVQLSFQDKLSDARVTSLYHLEILNVSTGVSAYAANLDKTTVEIPSAIFDDQSNYQFQVSISRQSAFLVKPVQFQIKANYQRLLDEKPFKDSNLVGSIDVQGLQAKAILKFVDKAPKQASVHNTYVFRIERNGGFLGMSRKTMVEVALDESKISFNTTGEARLGLVKDLGMGADQLDKYLTDGAKLYIYLTVKRVSPRLNAGKPIVIEKSKELRASN